MTADFRAIIAELKAQGRGPELAHPNAHIYWTGAHNEIGYICLHCGISYNTPREIEDHLADAHNELAYTRPSA